MAKVYVGTYGKYNSGSLSGGWLDLADYKSYSEFLAACHRLHKNERDPEFMIQDSEGFPDGLDCMEWISESDFNDVKLAMKEEQQEEQGKPAINIIEYSEKAFAVVGDTKAVKDALKKMGGSFNSRLSCGCGWIFSNKKREQVEAFLNGQGAATAKAAETKTEKSNKFTQWLDEYFTIPGTDKNFSKKEYVGAIKINGFYNLIRKESIETKFCFHDEGPNYELYKSLTSREEKMAAYFKAENLANYDNKIEHIVKGERYSGDNRIWFKESESQEYCIKQFYINYEQRSWSGAQEGTLCNEEERNLILEGLRFARKEMEKRLDTYLKRYGISKLHTWTYWADA